MRLLSVCISIVLTLLSINSIHAAGQAAPVKPVVIDIVELRELAPTSLYSGSVISKNDARLAAEVEGRLTWVADVGTAAEKGDVVATLDDTFLQQERREEQAVLKSEQAKLDLYSKDVERYQRLVKENNVAESQLDQSISDQTVARSNILAAEAKLAQLNERIARSKLRAPFNGVITERFSQGGEWAQNGMALVRLVDFQDSEIQVRVPQNIYSLISIGDVLTIINSEELIEAEVQTIVPVGTTASRLFELRLKPLSPILPGTLVRVDIPTAPPREVLSINRDALVIRKDNISVFRINGENLAEQISVKTGVGNGEFIELVGDIDIDDLLVTRGGERLRPGDEVQISQ
ncbi:MAG: efflux RND transporter periplasmic adaptor subunit [Pseudomonadota bacterium]